MFAYIGVTASDECPRIDYYYCERVLAEYALTKMGYTHRDAAKALGVGLSTINRWAQHPVQIEDYR